MVSVKSETAVQVVTFEHFLYHCHDLSIITWFLQRQIQLSHPCLCKNMFVYMYCITPLFLFLCCLVLSCRGPELPLLLTKKTSVQKNVAPPAESHQYSLSLRGQGLCFSVATEVGHQDLKGLDKPLF